MSELRHRYVDTFAGQLHLSECGAGPAVVLLHWVPLSARMYEAELPALAARGYRAVAPDLMGFGRSAHPDPRLDFAGPARAVVEGLRHAGIGPVAVLGAHYSVPVACEIAGDDAAGVTALLLDGAPQLLPPEAAGAIAARAGRLAGPGLHADGSHRSFLWEQAENAYRIFDPHFEPRSDNIHLLYRLIADYIATGMPADFGSFAPYDLAGRLDRLRLPVCVLSAETDPLRAALAPTVAAARDGRGVLLPGGHPLHDPGRAGDYAAAIADFLDDVGLQSGPIEAAS